MSGREVSRHYHKYYFNQGFFAVKRRAVFILGAKWKALVRGWRSDCVVGGMETRFQWRKAHSRTAKCEAFHFAPRLFFRFLFLIPFTIRQQCTIYPQGFSTEPNSCQKSFLLLKKCAFFTFFVGFVGFFLFLVYICGIFSRSINRQMCQLDATLKVDIGVEKGIQEK